MTTWMDIEGIMLRGQTLYIITFDSELVKTEGRIDVIRSWR